MISPPKACKSVAAEYTPHAAPVVGKAWVSSREVDIGHGILQGVRAADITLLLRHDAKSDIIIMDIPTSNSNIDRIACIAPLQARPEHAADPVLFAADIAFRVEVSSGLGGEPVTSVLDRLAVLDYAVKIVVREAVRDLQQALES